MLEINMEVPELFIPNFNKNFTGVSATAAAVARQQMLDMNLRMVGYPLPRCPDPISKREAIALSKITPAGRSHAIWHVRRNPEMRVAIWARDVLRRPIKVVFTSAAQRRHSAYPRWLISKMDAVIATTEKAAKYVPNVRAVIPHGVDTELFCPAKNRRDVWQKCFGLPRAEVSKTITPAAALVNSVANISFLVSAEESNDVKNKEDSEWPYDECLLSETPVITTTVTTYSSSGFDENGALDCSYPTYVF